MTVRELRQKKVFELEATLAELHAMRLDLIGRINVLQDEHEHQKRLLEEEDHA